MTLKRRTFWRRNSRELKAKTPMSKMSAKRREKLAAQGIANPSSTLVPKPREPKRAGYTGPKRSVTEVVDARSGKMCEWPGCGRPQTERHHRLNRKQGGRHGAMRARLNGAAWLLGACPMHHRLVTSPTGETRAMVIQMGWVLLEGQDATRVPVYTRHSFEPVWLDDNGNWHRFEDGAA